MNIQFKPKNLEDIEFELTISMTLKDWRCLSKQLPNEWPSFEISNQVTNMYLKANKHFGIEADE